MNDMKISGVFSPLPIIFSLIQNLFIELLKPDEKMWKNRTLLTEILTRALPWC